MQLSAVSKAVISNRETGDGYADILIKAPERRIGVVLEIKYAESENLEKYCYEALDQIKDKNYEQSLIDGGHGHNYSLWCSLLQEEMQNKV